MRASFCIISRGESESLVFRRPLGRGLGHRVGLASAGSGSKSGGHRGQGEYQVV